MKQVAKLVIIDPDDKYLLMYRSDHPTFGEDPDLPGGTVEDRETILEAMIREVREEVGVEVDASGAQQVYSGVDYSRSGTEYALFLARLEQRPEVVMSWEHSTYEWLRREEFLHKAQGAKDTYMHMVHDVVVAITSPDT